MAYRRRSSAGSGSRKKSYRRAPRSSYRKKSYRAPARRIVRAKRSYGGTGSTVPRGISVFNLPYSTSSYSSNKEIPLKVKRRKFSYDWFDPVKPIDDTPLKRFYNNVSGSVYRVVDNPLSLVQATVPSFIGTALSAALSETGVGGLVGGAAKELLTFGLDSIDKGYDIPRGIGRVTPLLAKSLFSKKSPFYLGQQRSFFVNDTTSLPRPRPTGTRIQHPTLNPSSGVNQPWRSSPRWLREETPDLDALVRANDLFDVDVDEDSMEFSPGGFQDQSPLVIDPADIYPEDNYSLPPNYRRASPVDSYIPPFRSLNTPVLDLVEEQAARSLRDRAIYQNQVAVPQGPHLSGRLDIEYKDTLAAKQLALLRASPAPIYNEQASFLNPKSKRLLESSPGFNNERYIYDSSDDDEPLTLRRAFIRSPYKTRSRRISS